MFQNLLTYNSYFILWNFSGGGWVAGWVAENCDFNESPLWLGLWLRVCQLSKFRNTVTRKLLLLFPRPIFPRSKTIYWTYITVPEANNNSKEIDNINRRHGMGPRLDSTQLVLSYYFPKAANYIFSSHQNV